jgi:hypothetical protein
MAVTGLTPGENHFPVSPTLITAPILLAVGSMIF